MNTATRGQHRELETPRPVAAQVDLVSGAVHVIAAGTGRAEVRVTAVRSGDDDAEAYAAQAEIDLTGDRLLVRLPHAHPFRRRHPEVRVDLVLPAGSDLELRGAAVSLTTDGPLGDVAVKVASGSLVVDAARGVTVKSAAGDVELGEVQGRVVVKSGSAQVSVGRADGGLLVVSAAGDVHAVRVSGDVHVQTGAGSVRLDALGAGTARLEARMGDVEVGVVTGLDVKLDLHSSLGAVECDLEPADGPAASSGRLELRAVTTTGRVHVGPSAV